MRTEGAHTRSTARLLWGAGLRRWQVLGATIVAVSLLTALGAGSAAGAASNAVPCSGSGGGAAGLVQAILGADTSGGTITLTAGCNYSFTAPYANSGSQDLADWYGPAALPAITAPITIVGNGATISRSTTAGTPAFRLFFVGANPSATATPNWTTPGAGALVLQDLTLSGGLAQGGSGAGGGGGGALGAGGAIYSQGSVVLTAVTLSGNSAQGGTAAGSGNGTGGAGMGASVGSGSTNGGGFGPGFVEPSGFAIGGSANLLGLGAGGGGAGFGTSENGGSGLLTGAGTGGGAHTGTGGDGELYFGAYGGDGGGGGSSTLDLAGGPGGDFGQGGTGGQYGGAGGGGVGGGGGGGSSGAGGGFGGGGGYPSGDGGFGAGGAGINGVGGFGAGNGSATTDAGGGAGMGGAVFNQQGTLIAENATLSGNTATGGGAGGSGAGAGQGLGGAIFSLNGPVALINDTIAANTADAGGALYVAGYDASSSSTVGAAVLQNDILSGSVNAAKVGTSDLVVNQPSTISDGAQNVASAVASTPAQDIVVKSLLAGTVTGTPSSANPMLGPLANNGGLGMFTMLPAAGSPALRAGATTNAPPTDERGDARPAGGPIDLGAVQVSGVSSVPGAPAPAAVTVSATPVTSSTAKLNGTVNPGGVATTYYFQYGTSTSYGATTSKGTLTSGTTAQTVTATISKLKPNTTYHFRIVATSTKGTTDGKDLTFKTARPGPTALTVKVTPRHATTFPYRFQFSGTVRLPKGLTNGAACSGKVSVLIKRGAKTVLTGHTSVFVGCSWKLSVRLSNRSAVPGHGNLSVTVSFAGNSVLGPRANKPFTISYG